MITVLDGKEKEGNMEKRIKQWLKFSQICPQNKTITTTKQQIQEAKQVKHRISLKKSTPEIPVKLIKNKDKNKKILKAARKKTLLLEVF